MDILMDQRWRAGLSPFDGQCLYCTDLLPLGKLRVALRDIGLLLKRTVHACPLCEFDDWHEHDGHISVAKSTTWDALENTMATDDSLYGARHGDAYVHRAYYPENLQFLLRFYVLDEDEEKEYPGIWGKCDLSAASDVLVEARSMLPNSVSEYFCIKPAKQYFSDNYAG